MLLKLLCAICIALRDPCWSPRYTAVQRSAAFKPVFGDAVDLLLGWLVRAAGGEQDTGPFVAALEHLGPGWQAYDTRKLLKRFCECR